MQPDKEPLADVRPKRQTCLPARLQDYEVDHMRDHTRDPSRWRAPPTSPPSEQAVFSPQYGPAMLSHLYSPQPPSGGSPRDAAHYKTPQLAPGRVQRRNLATDILPGAPISPQWSSYRDPPHPDVRAIKEENANMLKSQQVFQFTLKELHEARREMKELINVARSLREDMEQPIGSAASHSRYRPLGASAATSQPNPISLQPEEEAEEDWPAPLPWPEPDDNLLTDMSGLNLGQQDIQQNHPPHSSPDQAQSTYKLPTVTSAHSQFTHPTPYAQTLPHSLLQPSKSPSHSAPVHKGSRPAVLPQAAPPPTGTMAMLSPLPTVHPGQAPVSELVY